MAAIPLVAVLAAFVVPLLLVHMPFLRTRRPKRTLCLDDKGIKLSQTRHDRVRWKHVRRWFLAPVPGREELVALTVECDGASKPGRSYWSIVLDARDQKQAFLSELEYLRQAGRTVAPAVELPQPMPERSFPSAGLWATALAFYLFVHGLPLLAVGVLPHDHKNSGSDSSPARQTQIQRIMRLVVRRLHISNEKQLRMLFWLPGGLLTTAGIGLTVWETRRSNREVRAIYQGYDSELEAIRRSGVATPGWFKPASETNAEMAENKPGTNA
jgi:hypothetical protein